VIAPIPTITIRVALPPDTLRAVHTAVTTLLQEAVQQTIQDFLPGTSGDVTVSALASLEPPGGTRHGARTSRT
jgi:hypothetical protein